jgi:citrate lyase subunit beta / citryl-CoA lyase
VPDVMRARRSCLAVPGSSDRMIGKARTLPADEVFLDLEDACAPAAKPGARTSVIAALNGGDWGASTRAVRINDATTHWSYRDVVDVVEGAGANLDCLILPKADDAAQVAWLDLLLTQIEKATGLPAGRIGIEAQIESARGLTNVEDIAGASGRLEALIFGPADFIASTGMRVTTVGEQPAGYLAGDAYHYALMRLLVAARANGLQAIDGPYLQVRDQAGFRRAAMSSAALGYDGRWVLHPDQIATANDVFRPSQDDYDRAENILDAYAWHTSEAGGLRGAAMLGDEMIDEASRKVALTAASQGRAAGMQRKERWAPPA